MSLQNELRRTKLTNLEYAVRRLRSEMNALAHTISINIDCSLAPPEHLPMETIDSQFDELKAKWSELNVALSEIERLKAELA